MLRLKAMGIRIKKVYEEVIHLILYPNVLLWKVESSICMGIQVKRSSHNLWNVGMVLYSCWWVITKHRTKESCIWCCSEHGASSYRWFWSITWVEDIHSLCSEYLSSTYNRIFSCKVIIRSSKICFSHCWYLEEWCYLKTTFIIRKKL